MRDAASDFEEVDVKLFGISTDDVKTQKAFAKAQKLNFALLSDPNASVAKAYGSMMSGLPMAKRVTFVIDDAGVLRHIDRSVNVSTHGADLFEVVLGLMDE